MAEWFKDQRLVVILVVVVALFTTRWLLQSIQRMPDPAEQLLDDVTSPSLLSEHTDEFKKGVVKVTDGIYMAIGFALANSILIEAPEGAILVDTTESMSAGREVYAALRNVSTSPIKVIVYTHNHQDHVTGTAAFMNASLPEPEVWAHETLTEVMQSNRAVFPLTYARAMRQFGLPLRNVAPRVFRNSGIGPFLYFTREVTKFVPPTHLMKGGVQDVVLAGLPATLVHIPGETTDQMGVWIPSKRAFLCGDDLYRTFPNLYAIRGTPTRDTLDWVRSVDKMLTYKPEFLVPSHSRHLEGEEYIRSVLIDYRDAIKHVHDQTVRYMNKGMVPDDIITKVQLPETLKQNPFLHTFYGTVEWSVRAVFDRYMGWFSGNIAELSRHSTKEKAKRMIKLAGGEKDILRSAEEAIKEGDFRWALELATQVVTVNPEHAEAKAARLRALKGLAAMQLSANGRNYYLTVALEDHGYIETKLPSEMRKNGILQMTPDQLFEALTLRLKAEDAEGVNSVAIFSFTDLNKSYSLRIRNSVMDVIHGELEGWAVKVTLEYDAWRKVVAGEQSLLTLYVNGGVKVEGGMVAFKRFMDFVDTA